MIKHLVAISLSAIQSEPTVAPLRKPTAKERSSLQLTLESVATELSLRKTNSVPPPTTDIPNGDSISQFVTVINVPAPEGKETNGDQPALQQGEQLYHLDNFLSKFFFDVQNALNSKAALTQRLKIDTLPMNQAASCVSTSELARVHVQISLEESARKSK